MADEGDLRINGKVYDSNDLTWREEREVRQIVREHLLAEGIDEEDLTVGDILPAVVFVLHRRDNAQFTLDEALDLKPRDVVLEDEDEAKPRPTRRGSSRTTSKTSGAAGTPK